MKVEKVGEDKYMITIEGEDHSLGNLLARTLLSIKGVKFSYYEQPHPLEERIILFVELEGKKDLKEVLLKALEMIERTNEQFRRLLIEEAGAKGVVIEEERHRS